jgi:hypothetical protein
MIQSQIVLGEELRRDERARVLEVAARYADVWALSLSEVQAVDLFTRASDSRDSRDINPRHSHGRSSSSITRRSKR